MVLPKKRPASEPDSESDDSDLPCLCFICLVVKRNAKQSKRDDTVKLTQSAISEVKCTHAKWKKKDGLPPKIMKSIGVLDKAFALSATPPLVWHRSCRGSFMNTSYLDRFDDKETEEGN